MKVLFASLEVAPFAWTGGMGDVAGSLPKALRELGVDVRVIMPKHRGAAEKAESVRRVVDSCIVHMPWWVTGCAVDEAHLPGSPVPVYLVEHDQYFDREGVYGPPGGIYADNLERYSFFCRAAISSLRGLDWQPDVVHLNDWHTALLALYRNSWGLGFATVYTAHQLGTAYHGVFASHLQFLAGIDLGLPQAPEFVRGGEIDLARGGLALADVANTVSAQYAREVGVEGSEEGVSDLVARRGEDFVGILNGIDYSTWSPAHDPHIPAQYTAEGMSGKAKCKAALQRLAGLPVEPETPLVAMVSRLDALKGFDLVGEALGRISGCQMVFLGTGEARYEAMLQAAATTRGDVAAFLHFDPVLAHQIYAGADVFLMPSRREPAGLTQMVALAYGAIPVVHKTGGLADTISEDPLQQNGFVMDYYSAEDLLGALGRALAAYRVRASWQGLVRRGMACDFSWRASAGRYLALYERALAKRGRG